MEQFMKVHEEAIVVAAHTDIIASNVDYWRLTGEKEVLEKRHVPTLRRGGVDCVCDHIGGDTRYGYLPATNITTTPIQRVMRNFDHLYREEQESDSIVIARSVKDIRKAKKDKKIAVVICLEGGSPLEDEVAYLRNFYRLGLRMLGLTHDRRNSLAEGILERSGGGLSYFGADVVRECNELGIVVDAAHLSRKGIDDLLSLSSEPIIVSHGCSDTVYHNVWNLTDEHIRAIGQAGGVIAVHALNEVINDSSTVVLDDLLKHIIHIAEVGGIDSVAIGPDLMEIWQKEAFVHVTQGLPEFMSVPVKKINFSYPEGFKSVSEFPNITKGLLEYGMTENDVTKVIGGNCLRLCEQVWGE